MNASDFRTRLHASFGMQLIVTGLIQLVEKEGNTPHEAYELLEDIKKNTFHALSEINRGESNA